MRTMVVRDAPVVAGFPTNVAEFVLTDQAFAPASRRATLPARTARGPSRCWSVCSN